MRLVVYLLRFKLFRTMIFDKFSDLLENPIQAPLREPGKYPGADENDERCQNIGAPAHARDMDEAEHLYRAEDEHMRKIDFKTDRADKFCHGVTEHHTLDGDRIHQPCREYEHRLQRGNIKAADRGGAEEPPYRQGDDHKKAQKPDRKIFANQLGDILSVKIDDAAGDKIAEPSCNIAGNRCAVCQKVVRAGIIENKRNDERKPSSPLCPKKIDKERKEEIKGEDDAERPTDADDLNAAVGKKSEKERQIGKCFIKCGIPPPIGYQRNGDVNEDEKRKIGKNL